MANRASDNMANAAKSQSREFPLNKTIDLVMNNLQYQLTGETMYVPVWCGRPGMGKTTHAKIIAESLGLNMYYVSMYRPSEFFEGIPITNTLSFENNAEAEKKIYVKWSEPEMIHMANLMADEAVKSGKRGTLVFLDDMHIMSPDVQKAFFELVLERALGNYKFRDNICMLGAMNSSNLAGFDGFFSAINNRIQKIYVNLPFDYWYLHCGADLNPLIAGYVRNFRDALEEEESTDEPFATYRSWVQLSKIMDMYYKTYLDTHDVPWLLDRSYTAACSLMSTKSAQALKANIGQQLQFNYEAMVVNNAYKVDRDDPISQFCFANIIRYLRNIKDVNNLTDFLVKLVDQNSSLSVYENCILNVMYEVRSFMHALADKSDDESKARYEIIKAIPAQLFKKGHGKIHEILRRLTDAPISDREELDKLTKAN